VPDESVGMTTAYSGNLRPKWDEQAAAFSSATGVQVVGNGISVVKFEAWPGSMLR
jgi:hypothetical protein